MKDKIIPMFVYGTLMSETTLEMLGVAPTEKQNAILSGFLKLGLNIAEDEGSVVTGHYFQVNEEELKRIDRYEGIERNFYHRFLVNVRVGEHMKRAYVYQIKGT